MLVPSLNISAAREGLANKPLQQTAARRRDLAPSPSRRHLMPSRFLMRPQLNGGTLGGPLEPRGPW
jgi:hypothetical protein